MRDTVFDLYASVCVSVFSGLNLLLQGPRATQVQYVRVFHNERKERLIETYEWKVITRNGYLSRRSYSLSLW